MNIIGKRITLRALDRDDVDALYAWSNDPETVVGLGDIHFPTSRLQQEKWIERIQGDERTIRLGIVAPDGALIGYTGFWGINWRDRRAEHALVLGNAAYRGQGYGREVIATCARYAFEEMDLYRMDATILESNPASVKSYQSVGFQIEGLQREHALRGGQRVNRYILGLLAREYREWAAESGYWAEKGSA